MDEPLNENGRGIKRACSCNGPLAQPFTPRLVGVSTTTEGLRRRETTDRAD